MTSKLNEIASATTKPLGSLYPTHSIVASTDDYSLISFDLDENQGLVVIDFAADADCDKAHGATVAFDRIHLRCFISLLMAAEAALEMNP